MLTPVFTVLTTGVSARYSVNGSGLPVDCGPAWQCEWVWAYCLATDCTNEWPTETGSAPMPQWARLCCLTHTCTHTLTLSHTHAHTHCASF